MRPSLGKGYQAFYLQDKIMNKHAPFNNDTSVDPKQQYIIFDGASEASGVLLAIKTKF